MIQDERLELAHRFKWEVCEERPTLYWPKGWTDRINYGFCKRHALLPLREEGGRVVAAVADPLNLNGLDELRLILGMEIQPLYCPEEPLMTALQEAFRAQGDNASELLADLADQHQSGEDESASYDLLDPQPSAPVVRLLNAILVEAIQQGASDIHFEPLENDLRVRYRIDGVLQQRHSPSRDQQPQLLTRLKVMARLDIAEHRLPQDGRIKLRMGGREIDFRVSTIPISAGERIVLRILDRANVALGLDKLGIPQGTLKQLRELIRLPEGLLLVTGPTGSGKTTTLYGAISELNSEEVNIMTTEDPVEYKLEGIAQMGVRPKIGLTFASGLRHILRQDPDIVMVGEIRDRETAEIAIQASLTGHLVLSTLHTNDAPSAITRLVDMGIEPYLLASSIVGVLAQRLVRTLCPDCGGQQGLKAGECASCFGSGFKGRAAIHELMRVGPELRGQIVRSLNAAELRGLALEQGMTGLAQAGTDLVKAGRTTTAEVLRVTRGVED